MRPLMKALALAGLLAGCAAASFTPTPVAGPISTAAIELGGSPEAASRGRDIYTTRCARCHSSPRPESQTLGAWDRILPRMAANAKLDDAQTADVRLYILANLKARGQIAR